jgi:hypothetical protein
MESRLYRPRLHQSFPVTGRMTARFTADVIPASAILRRRERGCAGTKPFKSPLSSTAPPLHDILRCKSRAFPGTPSCVQRTDRTVG